MPKAVASKTSLKDMILSRLIGATAPETLRELSIDAAIAKALYGPEVEGEGQDRPEEESEKRVVDQSIGAMAGKTPGREEIKVGPAQEASGGGAERMIRQYSHPDPQQDIVVQYEHLSSMLGDVGKSMKTMSAAFAALLAKAEEHEEEKEEEHKEEHEAHKSVDSLAGEFLDDILAKAEDEDDEEEHEPEHHEAAEKALPASSKLSVAKALFEAVQAARKAKTDLPRNRVLKAAEAALQRAYRLAKAAEEEEDDKEAKKAAKKAAGTIAEFAFVRGMALTAKAVAKKAEEEEGHGKDEEDHNQKKWPSGGKAEGAVPGMEDILRGQAMLNGNITTLMDAISRAGNTQMAAKMAPAQMLAKSEGSTLDARALYKSGAVGQWETVKRDQIQAAVDSGEIGLSEELSAGTILATAQAVAAGATAPGMLRQRVATSSEAVRALFSEVLEA